MMMRLVFKVTCTSGDEREIDVDQSENSLPSVSIIISNLAVML